MLITEILARNARVYGSEIALIERDPVNSSRKEITWNDFDAEANQAANALMASVAGAEPLPRDGIKFEGTGADVMKRIAAPMVGGMVSATVLTLAVIPAIFLLWQRHRLAKKPNGIEVTTKTE